MADNMKVHPVADSLQAGHFSFGLSLSLPCVAVWAGCRGRRVCEAAAYRMEELLDQRGWCVHHQHRRFQRAKSRSLSLASLPGWKGDFTHLNLKDPFHMKKNGVTWKTEIRAGTELPRASCVRWF